MWASPSPSHLKARPIGWSLVELARLKLNSSIAEIYVNFKASVQVHTALATLAVNGQGHLLQKWS